MERSYMEGLEFSLRKADPSSMLLFPMLPLKSILLKRYGFFFFFSNLGFLGYDLRITI